MLGQTVKITVLKKLDIKDDLGVTLPEPPGLVKDSIQASMGAGCHMFKEGQEFIYTLGESGVPEGFCDWAWNDIFKDIMAVCSRAAALPKVEKGDIEPSYPCCTDGLRPVIFKIEAASGE